MALLSCIPILKQHFGTLRKDSSITLISLWFFIIPTIVAIIPIYYKISISESAINTLIAAFAIFVGFLLNVIIILIPIRSNKNSKIKQNVADHLHYNTLYSLIVSLLILSIALFNSFFSTKFNNQLVLALSFLIYVLIIHFILNLLLIIRRVYALFERDKEFTLL